MTSVGVAEPPGQVMYQDPSYPPPPPYSQAPPTYAQTVIIQQPTVTIERRRYFSTLPERMPCTHCGSDIVTSIDYRVGKMTWVACLMLVLLGLIVGCCFIPFCYSGAKDVYHHCPNCKKQLGAYHRM